MIKAQKPCEDCRPDISLAGEGDCSRCGWHQSEHRQFAPSNANTSGLEVVVWRHVMTDETGHDMMIRYGRNAEHPYGAPGEDYSKEFGVRSEPLVTAASAQAAMDEQEETIESLKRLVDQHYDRATAAEARADRLAKGIAGAKLILTPEPGEAPLTEREKEARQLLAALQQETQP